MIDFEEIWQLYDFTEAELLSMGWQLPNDYILNLNYYWDLNQINASAQVNSQDQHLKIILKSCIHLEVELNPNPEILALVTVNLGTIVGWGKVTPSPWLENMSLSPDEWIHLFFDLGGNNKIEAVCRAIAIEKLTTQALVVSF